MVSTKPHRKAAASIAKRKKIKKILLGASVKRHKSAVHPMSLALGPKYEASGWNPLYPQQGQQHQTVGDVAQQDKSSEVVVRAARDRVNLPCDERRKCQKQTRKRQHALYTTVFVTEPREPGAGTETCEQTEVAAKDVPSRENLLGSWHDYATKALNRKRNSSDLTN